MQVERVFAVLATVETGLMAQPNRQGVDHVALLLDGDDGAAGVSLACCAGGAGKVDFGELEVRVGRKSSNSREMVSILPVGAEAALRVASLEPSRLGHLPTPS